MQSVQQIDSSRNREPVSRTRLRIRRDRLDEIMFAALLAAGERRALSRSAAAARAAGASPPRTAYRGPRCAQFARLLNERTDDELAEVLALVSIGVAVGLAGDEVHPVSLARARRIVGYVGALGSPSRARVVRDLAERFTLAEDIASALAAIGDAR